MCKNNEILRHYIQFFFFFFNKTKKCPLIFVLFCMGQYHWLRRVNRQFFLGLIVSMGKLHSIILWKWNRTYIWCKGLTCFLFVNLFLLFLFFFHYIHKCLYEFWKRKNLHIWDTALFWVYYNNGNWYSILAEVEHDINMYDKKKHPAVWLWVCYFIIFFSKFW